MTATYNHTPADSATSPCEICASLDRERITAKLEALALEKGSENQRDRHAKKLLPEAELAQLARAELYAPLAGFQRWPMIRAGQVRHDYDCRVRYLTLAQQTDLCKFASGEGGQIDHDAYETLDKIEKAADAIRAHPWLRACAGKVDVSVYYHSAQCTLCVGPVVVKHSAIVRVNWAWRVLAREYSL